MNVQKVYTRGLNFLGQCGLGKKNNHIEKFTQVKNLPLDLDSVYTNYGGSFILSKDKKEVYYFGCDWDLRSFMRTTNAYCNMPSFMKMVKLVWPFLKGIPYNPCILHHFEEPVNHFSVGGNFAIAICNNYISYGIGDNYWVSFII